MPNNMEHEPKGNKAENLYPIMVALIAAILSGVAGNEIGETVFGGESLNKQDIGVLVLSIIAWLEFRFQFVPNKINPLAQLEKSISKSSDEE